MSLVTTQMPCESLKCLQRDKTNAVFPDPTGPPIPTVNARCKKKSEQNLKWSKSKRLLDIKGNLGKEFDNLS